LHLDEDHVVGPPRAWGDPAGVGQVGRELLDQVDTEQHAGSSTQLGLDPAALTSALADGEGGLRARCVGLTAMAPVPADRSTRVPATAADRAEGTTT
jgi:hypothetical protein